MFASLSLYARYQHLAELLQRCVHMYGFNVNVAVTLSQTNLVAQCQAFVDLPQYLVLKVDYLPAPLQHFRRDSECSSKVLLTHASNCLQKANV